MNIIFILEYLPIFLILINSVKTIPINSQKYVSIEKSSNETKKSIADTLEKKPICLMEGDIVCPVIYEEEKPTYFMASLDKNRIWTQRIIPYFIDTTYTESQSQVIKEAISDLESAVCIKFKLLSAQPNDEDFIWIRPIKGCYSSIGRTAGKQDLSLTSDCFTKGKGNVIHELIHSLGIWHEHTRPDRDKYIHVYFQHIIPEAQPNFNKRPLNLVDLLDEPYDYYSIMHYGAYDFSIDSKSLPTLWPLEKIDVKDIGQRSHISDLDKKKLNKLYRCDISHCPDLVSPTHGSIHGSDFSVGSVVKFECEEGLTLVGSNERFCQYNAIWSGREVLCLDKLYHYCNFEKVGNEMCGWTDVSGSDFKWQRRNGATPNEDTGPIEDFTYETIRGHYIFMETSAPQRKGDKAKIATPIFTSTSSGFVCISFAYYMWGEKLGTLSLYISETSTGDKLIWEKGDNLGPHWLETKLILELKENESFKLIFDGVVGSKGTSDIALDEVLVLQCDKDDSIKKGFQIVH